VVYPKIYLVNTYMLFCTNSHFSSPLLMELLQKVLVEDFMFQNKTNIKTNELMCKFHV